MIPPVSTYRKTEDKPRHSMSSLIWDSQTRPRDKKKDRHRRRPSFSLIFLQLNRQTNRQSRANRFETNGHPGDKRVFAREIKVGLARDIRRMALIYEVDNDENDDRFCFLHEGERGTISENLDEQKNLRKRERKMAESWPTSLTLSSPFKRYTLDFIVLFV